MPSRARCSRLALALTAILAAPAAADATELAAIVRGAGAGSDTVAGYVSHFARYYLAEDGRYEVVAPADRLGHDGAEAASARDRGAELFTRALGAYETLELDPAVESLTAALAAYQRGAAALADVAPVADALMLLGAVHVLRGDERAGAERLAEAVAIRPDVQPDPRIFNPSMRQVFQQASERLAQAARGSISVGSSPSHAEVYVDGAFRGVTPTVVADLAPGRHYLRIEHDGWATYGSVVTVPAGRGLEVQQALAPTAQLDRYERAVAAAMGDLRVAGDLGEERRDPAFAELGALLRVDHVFLAEVRLDGDRVEVHAGQYDLRRGRRLKTASDVFGYDARPETFARAVGDLLRTQFGETTLARRAEAAGPSGTGVPGPATLATGGCLGLRCATLEKVTLYGGVGGGLAMAGAGGVLYLLAWRNQRDLASTPRTSARARELESAGKLEALVGDVLVPVGVLAAAAGLWAYLVYVPPEAAGSDPVLGVAAVPLAGGAVVAARLAF